MKDNTFNLRIPGPTPIPSEVIKSSARQMINHRGKTYEEIQKRITGNLKYFFQTENDILLLTSSGMGGLEAAVVNFFSPGDKLVFFTCGEFGNRWAEIGKRYGADVVHVKFTPGKRVDKDTVYEILEKNDNVSGVFITHNETATGVINPIPQFSSIISNHKNKPLFLVDSISALGAVDLPADKLGIDVLVTASQKAWMAPPGIAMISVSRRAWNRQVNARMPKYYFDLSMYREFSIKNQTPATPAVGVLYGLDKSLEIMRKEGREEIFKKHTDLKDYIRGKIKSSKLQLFVTDDNASPTVTSIRIPIGIDFHQWIALLREKYKVVVVGGMGETKGKIIRIAHMGYVTKNDLDQTVTALIKSLEKLS
ncbi:hypothetical protein A3B48_00795 [Candidatus Gottesmanbacteria bacterium RIFCSPLOWO2_01_FULL_40_10]|uniref:Aminotransferase class V domain-containing protein n=1 Tax=Candidatus Gottesmanbacteria bacterium RIFCSPHIGHO2_01_FULL_40_15 TaxID=1798376 RepID=A0A1F5Z0C8_9BACT|nr:MAG: hypothetical protein A2777_00460 [Candidatus Gottesmanbacteria bacterium RIFCSPHIGHO2_01_FULL_40_15]OGG20960.1 MAG: hypothetical protein A3B48_00795 [Candidatus Gottesmanbacteria bacterium RIFCSPLOWO2_01_FULL_40_10]